MRTASTEGVSHRRQEVQQAVKNACDKLNDDGVDPRNYIEQLAWLFFLKAFDETEDRREQEAAFDDDAYRRRLNGRFDLVGRCAVHVDSDRSFAFASYLIRLRVDPARVLSVFLMFFLASTMGRDAIAAIRRTSAGQFNINVQNLRGIRLPLPPLAIQAKVAERLTNSAILPRRLRLTRLRMPRVPTF